MSKKYEIGSPIISPHLNCMTSEGLFVVTRRDLLKLELELIEWDESEKLNLHSQYHPEVFFHFENFPVPTAFGSIEKAKKFLEKGKIWYGNHLDGQRFWVEVKSIKS